MLPLGSPTAGHKGFGPVGVLAGVLTGSGFALGASTLDAKIGHFFWALDVTAFGPRDESLARVDAQIEQIRRVSGSKASTRS